MRILSFSLRRQNGAGYCRMIRLWKVLKWERAFGFAFFEPGQKDR